MFIFVKNISDLFLVLLGTNQVVRLGICCRHGANKKKLCRIPNCKNQSVRDGELMRSLCLSGYHHWWLVKNSLFVSLNL